jgi:ribonuclease D
MAQLLGERRTGLGALLAGEFGMKLDKRFQRADWGKRPLSAACLDYAAADTAHVEKLAEVLRERLEALDRWAWAEEEFARLETVRHAPPEPDPLAFERIKGARRLKGAARDRLYSLFEWRDRRARRADIPPFKILGARPMLELAGQPPADRQSLARVAGLGPRFSRRWGAEVLACLAKPKAAPEPLKVQRSSLVDPRVKDRLKKLLETRDALASEIGLDPGLVCPKGMATAVALIADGEQTNEAFDAAGLTGWRLELLGDRFIEALSR